MTGEREPIPLWLADGDYPAPCPCGQPMLEGEPVYVMQSEETGFTRAFHVRCIQGGLMEELDDDE